MDNSKNKPDQNPPKQNNKNKPKKQPPKSKLPENNVVTILKYIVTAGIAVVIFMSGFFSHTDLPLFKWIIFLFFILIELDFCLFYYSLSKSPSIKKKIPLYFSVAAVITFLFGPFLLIPLLLPNPSEQKEKLEMPEIELSVAEPLDPFDPLEYPFVIKNVGKTKILDLNINEKQIIEADRGNSMNGQFTSIYLQTTELLPHESTTFVLGHLAKLERIRKITVIFMISYNTTSGQTINKELKYVGVRTQEWTYNWYPKSMAEE